MVRKIRTRPRRLPVHDEERLRKEAIVRKVEADRKQQEKMEKEDEKTTGG